MWIYKKTLQYPVDIKHKDLKMAKYLLEQYGGPYGELGACIQYLNQRFTMPDERGKALLTDIGTEEIGHCEMIASMVYQLIKGATPEELKEAGLGSNYAKFSNALFPSDSTGNSFTCDYVSTTGDFIADLESDMASEQKARATYEHLIDMTEDPDILGPLLFLRQREVVHYDLFKDLKDFYSINMPQAK